MEQHTETFSFASSSALDLPVCMRINKLDGHQTPIAASKLLRRADLRHVASNVDPLSELYVTVQAWADSKPLAVPVQTPYKSFRHSRTWNEWLELPLHYSVAPLSAQLAITVWDLSVTGAGYEGEAVGHAIPFGGTTISLFDEEGMLRKGRQRCQLHRRKRADGLSSTTTPAIVKKKPRRGSRSRAIPEENEDDPDIQELERLEELIKKHEMGEIPADDWLDDLVTNQISQIERRISRKLNTQPRKKWDEDSATTSNGGALGKDHIHGGGKDPTALEDDDDIDLGHYFLYIDFPRFDHPIVFTDHEYPAPPISTLLPQSQSAAEVRWKPPPEVTLGPGINSTADGEVGPLIRIYDPEVGIKDNPVENKHRRLVRNQRTGVLDRDLKPNPKIRDELSHIVSAGPSHELKAEEKDLVWKFRHHLTRNKKALTKFVKSVTWSDADEARQAVVLLPKWTEIDVDDALELLGPSIVNSTVRTYAIDRLRKADDEELLLYLLQLVQALKFEKLETADEPDAAAKAQDSSLAKFLIARAANNVQLGNFLHWYLMVECDDQSPGQSPEHRRLFAKVEYEYMAELVRQPGGQARRAVLRRQGELITVLSKISRDVRFAKGGRPRKIEQLRKSLAEPANELLSFSPPLPLPLDPQVEIVGMFVDECSVFLSSLFPLLLVFKTAKGERYPLIFKMGDDLRQDQLVIQIIMLMDRLLRKENLDLKLSPYRILATSTSAGAVQFVPSMALANIADKYRNSVLAYLRANNPDERQPLGVRAEAMDTYVKSCAGYCVITYLLGVGDRHLDNLLITPTGRFFHADFGYILGRDPKPFAPLMKLSKEMIEGMGGAGSRHYQEFKQHCFTAYTTLRKSSNLILNLFSLMVDANIPDIRMEPDKAVAKVKERFHLELRTEDEVIRMFEGLMEDSMSAMFPAWIDLMHNFTQRLKT